MRPSRILILGRGGREHALAWRLARDAHAPVVELAPGPAGAARAFRCHAAEETDAESITRLAHERGIDLIVVGPEGPLAAGVSDQLAAAGLRVFGPSRAAARLESSKWFAKEVLLAAAVPTAHAERHTRLAEALESLVRFEAPWVVKADGLAAGKGVLVSASKSEVAAFLASCLEGARFGEGGRAVVIEQHLRGEEVSVMAVCDGERAVLLPPARDYKRAEDGDQGPNTGGMGSFAPAASLDAAGEREVMDRVVTPVLRHLAALGTPYRGALYCGLMLTREGPQVIEFNARFGDPETQSILPLVEGSFSDLLASAADGALLAASVTRSPRAAVTVALVAEGYPDAPQPGGRIVGLDALEGQEDLQVFHAGTRWQDGWVVDGGRAAYVTAIAADIAAARDRVMRAVGTLSGARWRARSDIAERAVSEVDTSSTAARAKP